MGFRTNRQAGLTLLEVIISLGILSMALVGINNVANRFSDDTKVTVTASQQRTFGDAARAYIKDNYSAVMAVATSTSPALIDVSTLIAAGKLPSGYTAVNAYGQTLCALVLQPSANRLQALVVSENGSALDDLSLGSAAGIVGGSGGGVYSSNTALVRGAVGGWSIPVATFDNLTNNLSRRCDGTSGNVRVAVGHPVMALWFENGDTTSAFLARDSVPGRPELNEMNTPLVMNSIQTANGVCTRAGAVARDSTGAVLSCQSGVWKTQGSAFWQDPVANFAALPACTASISGQTRVVSSPSVGSGPRAYTCNGASWAALAIDDSGNFSVANNLSVGGTMSVTGVATVGKLGLSDVVTVGSACSVSGLISRDSTGQILSCQSGVYKAVGPKFSSTPIYGYTPSSQYISGCGASPGYLTVTTPGFYGINVDAVAYRYYGSYVSLYVSLAAPSGAGVCSVSQNLPAGGGTGYFTPSGYCMEHLDAGTYTVNVGGSDASACGTSSLYMLFNGSAKLRLLIPD